MSALGRVARSGVGRRRVQTVVIVLATMMAVTASVMCAALLAASAGPFDKAFRQQHGAHLSVRYDAEKATAARLAASADATGVTAAAGPFPTVSATARLGGQDLQPMSLVGRAGHGGPVDDVTLTEGRWAARAGEIVLSDNEDGPALRMGTELGFPQLPGKPTLTVVGMARSVSRTADAWVMPSLLSEPDGYQMLYRFKAAATARQVAADRAAVTASVPKGTVDGARSWLATKKEADRQSALFVPFLAAFGVLGLVMAVLIVGNVVAGAVGAGTRRIGVLKALGFTPSQVVRAYVGQALIPAAAGTAIGVVGGNLLAVPVLTETATAYGSTSSTVPLWIDVTVAAGMLGLVAVTAWAGALRAGRLRAVDAIAVGRPARPGRGLRAARLAGRLPLPRPVGLGLARPFARPARAAATAAAVTFGAVAVTFAVGLASSLTEVQAARNHDTSDVTVHAVKQTDEAGGPPRHVREGVAADPTDVADPAAVTRAIDARSGTRRYFGVATTEVALAGATGSVEVSAFTGDPSWSGYRMISGRWFKGPGEAVVPTPLLAATGTRVGDRVTLHDHGRTVAVRIVGEVFSTENQGRTLLTDAATLKSAEPKLRATEYRIAVRPGTDAKAYARDLSTALQATGATAAAGQSGDRSSVIFILDALTSILTLMLVAVAGLSVLNSVVLDTRERVRDLGIHRALGMTPRQTITMVIASVVGVGLLGGAVGVPVGLALHDAVMPAMGHSAGLTMPASVLDVYDTPELVLLGFGGLLIAVAGALLPAGWAARTRTATALRTE
ncbi:ABC transporter permease [Streptomyces sp. R21]|uniref:ABC transporter permease n=1 Tax=Streptomyces sp. R21 TaxID=3238627 RepID=A0AB39PGH3_9ACTN